MSSCYLISKCHFMVPCHNNEPLNHESREHLWSYKNPYLTEIINQMSFCFLILDYLDDVVEKTLE